MKKLLSFLILSLLMIGISIVGCNKETEEINQVVQENVVPQEKIMTAKKGVGLTESTFGNTQLSLLNVSWYYSWGYTTDLVNPPAQFIPMVFSLNTLPSVTPKPTILGFNEPDNSSQSNMSVANCNCKFATLVNNSTLVGSPATAGNPLSNNSWLTQFMNWTPKPKVDFVCVHWYKGVDYAKFKSDMTAIINLYGKPIWVTEFAPQTVSSASSTDQIYSNTNQYILKSSYTLDGTKSNGSKNMHTIIQNMELAIFTTAGQLTPTGVTYRDTLN